MSSRSDIAGELEKFRDGVEKLFPKEDIARRAERNREMALEFLQAEDVYIDNEPSVHVKGGYYADIVDLLVRFYERMAGE